MDITSLGVQIVIGLAIIVFLWLFIKTLKIIWKVVFIVLIFLVLSFALPALREWILNLF